MKTLIVSALLAALPSLSFAGPDAQGRFARTMKVTDAICDRAIRAIGPAAVIDLVDQGLIAAHRGLTAIGQNDRPLGRAIRKRISGTMSAFNRGAIAAGEKMDPEHFPTDLRAAIELTASTKDMQIMAFAQEMGLYTDEFEHRRFKSGTILLIEPKSALVAGFFTFPQPRR